MRAEVSISEDDVNGDRRSGRLLSIAQAQMYRDLSFRRYLLF